MFISTYSLISFLLLTALPFGSLARPAEGDDEPSTEDNPSGGAIEIIKPEEGFVIRGPEPYYRGATQDIDFELQGDESLTGKVRVSFVCRKGKAYKPLKDAIPINQGRIDNTMITVLVDKLRAGNCNFKVVVYDENNKKIDEVTQKIKVVKPDGPSRTQEPKSTETESETGTETEQIEATDAVRPKNRSARNGKDGEDAKSNDWSMYQWR